MTTFFFLSNTLRSIFSVSFLKRFYTWRKVKSSFIHKYPQRKSKIKLLIRHWSLVKRKPIVACISCPSRWENSTKAARANELQTNETLNTKKKKIIRSALANLEEKKSDPTCEIVPWKKSMEGYAVFPLYKMLIFPAILLILRKCENSFPLESNPSKYT